MEEALNAMIENDPDVSFNVSNTVGSPSKNDESFLNLDATAIVSRMRSLENKFSAFLNLFSTTRNTASVQSPDISLPPTTTCNLPQSDSSSGVVEKEANAISEHMATLRPLRLENSANSADCRHNDYSNADSHPHVNSHGNKWGLLPKSLTKGLLPQPFTGMHDSNPVHFCRSVSTFLRLQPLELDQFMMLMTALLQDRAGQWFRKHEATIQSAEHFFSLFRQEFISRHYLRSLQGKISSERQGKEEKTVIFIDKILKLYGALPDDPSEIDIIDKILMSVRRDVALHLSTRSYDTIGELRAQAYVYDRLMSKDMSGEAEAYKYVGRNESANTQLENRSRNYVQFKPEFVVGSGHNEPRPVSPSAVRRSPNAFSANRYVAGPRCFSCSQVGHYRRDCWKTNQNKQNQGNDESRGD